jgi:hypothetical protein
LKRQSGFIIPEMARGKPKNSAARGRRGTDSVTPLKRGATEGRTADPSASLRDDKKERAVMRRGRLPRGRAVVGAVGTSKTRYLHRQQPFFVRNHKSDNRSGWTKRRGLSLKERAVVKAIVKGSTYPPPQCPLATVPSLQRPSPFCHPERTRISCFTALTDDPGCGSLQREPHAAHRSRNSRQEIRGSRGICGAPFGGPAFQGLGDGSGLLT